MKKLILIVICLFYSEFVFCQIFLSDNNYKTKVAQDIYVNLVNAYASGLKPPLLMLNKNISNNSKYIATYFPGDNPIIIIDEELYDICTSFGIDSLNALASLLSHELAHHFKQHLFCSDFVNSNAEKAKQMEQQLKLTIQEKISLEKDADFNACFYGHIAGYKSTNIFQGILDKIYDYYKLPAELEGYPTLNERKAISNSVSDEIKELLAVFDVAEMLFLIKEFDKASICFDYLITKFPSREMYNNSAIVKLYSAFNQLDYKNFPFAFPLEFDSKTRLKLSTSRTTETNIELFKKSLNESLKLFEKASNKDSDYNLSKLNSAICYILLSKIQNALDIINDIDIKYLNKNELSNYYTINGICQYYLKNYAKSEEYFLDAFNNLKTSITNYNYQKIKNINKTIFDDFINYINCFIENENIEFKIPEQTFVSSSKELIGNESVNYVISEKLAFFIPLNENFKIGYNINNSHFIVEFNNEKNIFLKTEPNYKGSSLENLKIGSTIAQIKEKYGIPSYTFPTSNFEYIVYNKRSIVFKVNKTGRIVGWFIFLNK